MLSSLAAPGNGWGTSNRCECTPPCVYREATSSEHLPCEVITSLQNQTSLCPCVTVLLCYRVFKMLHDHLLWKPTFLYAPNTNFLQNMYLDRLLISKWSPHRLLRGFFLGISQSLEYRSDLVCSSIVGVVAIFSACLQKENSSVLAINLAVGLF